MGKKGYQKLEKSKKKYGIFWEFIRYYNCEYSANLQTHRDVLRIREEREESNRKGELVDIDAKELRMEDFQTNFSKAANLLADAWNIKDTLENRKVLEKNGYGMLSIKKSRKKFLNYLDKWANVNSPRALVNATHHMTSRVKSTNRTKDRIDLLTFSQGICKKLKEMTLEMHYKWEYSHIC